MDARLGALYGRRWARRLEASRLLATSLRLPERPPGVDNDLAALVMVAGAMSQTGQGQATAALPNAGTLALVLLRQAVSSGGGCAPQLNLAFLWSADTSPVGESFVASEYAKAVAACPTDPTPLWALGEYQSELENVSGGRGAFAAPAGSTLAPFVTFRLLERRFPSLAAGWAGAGDAALRVGYQLPEAEAFTAREWFSWARADFERAVTLQPDDANRAGLARAQAGLGEFAAAIATQRRAVAGYPASADLEARLLDYLQRGRRFREAVAVAGKLMTVHDFPSGVELFPVPEGASGSGQEDADGPLSTGVGQTQPAEIGLPVPSFASGAPVANLTYLPVAVPMQGIGGLARWCPDWSQHVDLLLSHQPAAALAGLSSRVLDDLRSDPVGNDCSKVLPNGPSDLAGVAELDLGNVGAAIRVARPTTLADLEDLRQNLWRYAGDFAQAALAAAQWAALEPDNPVPVERQGETAFLRRRYDEAARYFAIAVNRDRLQYRQSSPQEALALLDQGTSLSFAGRRAAALTALASAGEVAARAGSSALSALAMEQAGDTELNSRHALESADDYAVAADAEKEHVGRGVDIGAVPLHPEALANNQALADIATGQAGAAVPLAAKAIDIDPDDPIFWWTEAAAEQGLGRTAAAIADYRHALAFDPTLYPVANNLGVLLMRRAENAAAAAALRRAVGANRGYATGWFNLGVALEREGPLQVVASEGCLARARALDGSLSSRGPVPLLDDTTYQSHLDLSKPLPANWTFVSSQNRTSVTAAGLSAILVLALGLARSLGGRVGAPGGAQKWFDAIGALQRRAPTVYTLHPPAIGILATLAFLLWPLHSGPTDGWAATLVFALGILTLIAVVLRVRLVAATRAHVKLREQTWPPALAFGLVITLVGAGWSPLPVARTPKEAPTVHWAGPTAVAALAIVLLVLATWLQVPLTRSLGAAGLVMAASLLTPVPPLDGATVSSTAIGALPTLAVLGAAVLMLVGLL